MNKLFSSLSFERNFWTTVNKENSKLQSSLSKVRKIDFGLMAQKQSWKKKKKTCPDVICQNQVTFLSGFLHLS